MSNLKITAETTRTDIDIAYPFQVVTFAPRLGEVGLRAMAETARKAADDAGGDHDMRQAWRALYEALYGAAGLDAGGHGAALAEPAALQAEPDRGVGAYAPPDSTALRQKALALCDGAP